MDRLEPTLTKLDERIDFYVKEAGGCVVYVIDHHDVVTDRMEFVYLQGLLCIVTLHEVAYLEFGSHSVLCAGGME